MCYSICMHVIFSTHIVELMHTIIFVCNGKRCRQACNAWCLYLLQRYTKCYYCACGMLLLVPRIVF